MPYAVWLSAGQWLFLGFVPAVLGVAYAPALPVVWVSSAAGLLLSLAFVRYHKTAAWFVLGVTLGLARGAWHGEHVLAAGLPLPCEGLDLEVRGRVLDMPHERRWGAGRGVGTELLLAILPVRQHEPGCNWRGGKARVTAAARIDVQPGEILALTVRLRRPWGLLNPGGDDAQARAVERGIVAVGSVRPHSLVRLESPRWYRSPHQRVRLRLRQALLERDLPPATRAVLMALTIGDRSDMSSAQWRLFQQLGINHIVVVSGLHIGLLAGLGLLLGGVLGRLAVIAGYQGSAQTVGIVFAMALAAGYAALAGFGLPTVRALVAVLAVAVCRLGGRHRSAWQGLLLGLAVIALLQPMAALSPGFWLSFGAVAAILWVLLWQPALRAWRLALVVQGVLGLALLPLTGWWFGSGSLIAPLVNLLVVPLASFWVVPAALSAAAATLVVPVAAPQLWSVAAWPVQHFLDVMGRVPAEYLALALLPVSPTPMTAGLAMAGTLLLVLPLGSCRWLLVPLLWLPILWEPQSRELPPTRAVLTILDVGQGTAVVWRQRGYTLVYDTAGGGPGGMPVAERTLVPYLRRSGVRTIDDVVVSHADTDHAGGIGTLLQHFHVKRVLTGQPLERHPSRQCRAGQVWRQGDTVLQLLGPSEYDSGSNNDLSCVLRIIAGDFVALLPGDVGRAREQGLASYWREDLAASVLLAPHHGSRTSSSHTFIKWVGPQYVVFSSGYRSRFGHPHPEIVTRYRLGGATILNTAESGALEFIIDNGRVLRVQQARQNSRRYWR